MKRTVNYLPLLLGVVVAGLATACQPPASKVSIKQLVSKPLEQLLTDSLRRYWHLTSFQLNGDSARYVLYGQETTSGKLGVVALTDSVLLLYQGNRQGMRLVGRVPFASRAFEFKVEDLNDDSQDDLLVFGQPNMHGEAFPYVFIQKNQALEYRPDIKLMNLSYDADRRLVQSYHIGGVFDTPTKGLYQWQHDSLRQIAGAELTNAATQWTAAHPPPTDNDSMRRILNAKQVRVFQLRNGREYNLRTYRNEAVFDTILFTQNYFR